MTRILIAFALAIAFSCSEKQPVITAEAHLDEVEKWHSKRVENLKGPQGWLNVSGLYWLKDGMNTFGSAENNDLVFPAEKIGEYLGYFVLRNDTVMMEAGSVSEIKTENQIVTSLLAYPPDSTGIVPKMEYGSLQWFIIERDGKFGVRLRDFESDAIHNFHGIERYPVDLAWRVEARFEKAEEGRTIDITNILGQTTPNPSPGTLVFAIDDEEHRLDVINDGGPDFFVIFGDPTNEKETYPAGRYVYVAPPGEDGKTFIDFNKCYNPPCAFTAFATCPLPPRQNVLTVPVLAGEKNYATESH
jgi:uncharacterized protein (DUF1684 family)